MSLLIIIMVVVALVAVLLLVLVDDAAERLTDWLFSLVGLESGNGPLAAEAVVEGECLVINLVNQGKHRLLLRVIEGRDSGNKPVHPVPYLAEDALHAGLPKKSAFKQFSKLSIPSGESKRVMLQSAELAALDCQTLAVLDSKGRSWPVEGYPKPAEPVT